MLENRLARRAPAVHALPPAGTERVRIALAEPEARFAFRAKAAHLGGRGDIAGFRLDGAINSRTGEAERLALRLGPDEWLLTCPEDEADTAVAALGSAMEEMPHALVDVSHRDVSFEVSGPAAEAVLNAGCPLDLSPVAFPVGMASRTLLGKAEIVLARLGPDTWRLSVWRSFAPYVQAFLRDAAEDHRDRN